MSIAKADQHKQGLSDGTLKGVIERHKRSDHYDDKPHADLLS
jgi:hypothetical protein